MTLSSTAPPRVFLQAGRDRRVAEGHPWVYSNELRMDAETKALPPGTLATLHRVDGRPFGIGTFNPHALIAFRLFDRDPNVTIDAGFLAERFERALDLRGRFFDEPYHRLVHAEADGLPGLIADRFGEVIALQVNTAGMEALTPEVLDALDRVLSPATVVLRNDQRARILEGLETRVDVVKGNVQGPVEVRENGLVFAADVMSGQKTGWYYDQRENRTFVAPLAADGRMLDVYCHSGGFCLMAAARGAEQVVGVDSSEPALALAHRSAEINGLSERCRFVRGDAFHELARLSAAGERFRVVVADPPAFVKSRKELGSGLKGYRKLARLAAPLVEPGGFLFIASCSHNLEAAAFATEVAKGATAAGRSGRIIRAAGAGPDHPQHPYLPETAYLKTLVLRLD